MRTFPAMMVQNRLKLKLARFEPPPPAANVLGSVGDMHAQLASLSAHYHEQLAENVVAVLERRADDYRDFEKALKDAEKKRTTLDALMAKVRKFSSRRDRFE